MSHYQDVFLTSSTGLNKGKLVLSSPIENASSIQILGGLITSSDQSIFRQDYVSIILKELNTRVLTTTASHDMAPNPAVLLFPQQSFSGQITWSIPPQVQKEEVTSNRIRSFQFQIEPEQATCDKWSLHLRVHQTFGPLNS